MQISKTLLVVCTVVCCAGSISLAESDSPSQAQAREALRKKIAELNAQAPATETPALKAPSAEKKAAPAPTFQPVAQPPPATITPAPAPATPAPAAPAPAAAVTAPPSTTPIIRSSPEETARQREALRQKLAELSAQEKAGQPAPAPATTAPVVKSPKGKSTDVIKAEQTAAAAEAKAREADQKAAAAEAEARNAKRGKAKPGAVTKVTPAVFAPLEAPPSAVPASKEAKLVELLRKYKADDITPEEYHKERAKILAEP